MPTIHDRLNSLIDHSSPKLATFLQRMWKSQQNAITYKELREAILSGKLDKAWLKNWQQDYSQFVANSYAPIATNLATQAAKDLLQSYGGYLIDPARAGIDKFINKQGALLVKEISAQQYLAINTLVHQAAMTETMTVDQLARAIRPCIGLTQRQAQTTYKYHDALIQQGYTPEEARRKQAIYAEKMHRRRAATIASTELAYAHNAGADAAIQHSIDEGLIEPDLNKEWSTAEDERVCDICGKLNGIKVPRGDKFPGGIDLPPAHPNCRCAVLYTDLKAIVPKPQPAQPTSQSPAQVPDPDAPSIPEDIQIGQLTYRHSNAWGTGEMHHYTDATGQDWIFKPGQTKSGSPEAFRAYVQEAGYKVQGIVDPDTAVPVGTITLDTPNGTKFGALQQRIEDLDDSFNLKAWQNGGKPPSAEIIAQLQKENVTDWLMCNYDSHGGNFVLKNDGTLFGLDKEQAFRYITNPKAQTMSYTFHPNAYYGETEPVYNTLYRKFAKGEIDINLNDTLAYLKRVEAIPDAEYREIFRGYAEALHGKGNKAEQLLDMITARKNNARAAFETFYSELLTERNGKKTAFKFIDQAATAASQSLQATSMSAQALKGMSLSDLKDIAKASGIKYSWNMNKTQLIDAISDPSKTAQIVADAKARAYGIGTTPRKPKPIPPTTALPTTGRLPKVDGVTQIGTAMDDFDEALKGTNIRGTTLIGDKAALEGMQMTLRKVDLDGREYFELNGKLTYDRWMQANDVFDSIKGKTVSWDFEGATGFLDYSQNTLTLTASKTKGISIGARTFKIGEDYLMLADRACEQNHRAMMGEFSLRIYTSDGQEAARRAQALLKRLQLEDITLPVDNDAMERYKKMRLIWQHNPAAAARLDPVKSTDGEIQRTLARLGITQDRIDKMKLVRITDDYFTFIDPGNIDLANQKNVAYIWSGVSNKTAAASIIESGEMISSSQRLKRGVIRGGASVDSDFRKGGADSVFTRVAMDNNVGVERFSSSFAEGSYQFIFDKKALARTDWYAYTGDEFGSTIERVFHRRNSVSAHFDALNGHYYANNELMFKKSLSLNDLQEIRCRSQQEKQELIDLLNAKGITTINGKKLDKYIKVTRGRL